jgi:hypothetical protein
MEGNGMKTFLTRKKLVVTLVIAGLLGATAWRQRKPFLASHYVARLSQAEDADRESWVAEVVALDEAAVPALLAALASGDKKTCANLESALVGLARNWGAEDPRSQALLEQVAVRFESLPVFAKNAALQIPVVILRKTPEKNKASPAVTRLAGELLTAATKAEGLRVAALHLAGAVVERVPHGQWLDVCRGLALQGLAAADVQTRAAAVQLVLRAPLRQENDLVTKVVPLLKDSAALVRKSALVVLGPARELVSDDDLLPLLHDPDDEVQNLCELALRGRGLQENHILLARLISDERPGARLEVLHHLREATDLEPGVWLRRLCQDPAPAVRAAAVRAAVSQSRVDLRSCLDEMAQQDPSPTVRQLAGHYLRRSPWKSGD